MSKYDFEIDLSDRTSTGIILNKIPRGSDVLEFGCATGRMTRYMKEALDCRVYIVEFDEQAFEKAKQYARDGICDDIMNYRWMESFGDVRFDAIIFADVLEHLSRPEEVLKQAAKLLKEHGRIHVSVPNVTHNDIVLKACAEHFDYTKTGLLDEDHVHFWGLENLKQLPAQCGLNVASIEGTYCATGDSEQGMPMGGQKLLTNILRDRRCGEVYQFVVTLDKGEISQPVCNLARPFLRSCVYLDTGAGFNARQSVAVEAVRTETGSYLARHRIEEVRELENIRFDPVELQDCILLQASFTQGDEKLNLGSSKVLHLPGGLYMYGDDPMIWAEVTRKDAPIDICVEFMLPGEAYLDFLENSMEEETVLLERMGLVGEDAQQRLNQWLGLWDQSVILNRELEKSRLETKQVEKEAQQIQNDLCGYIILSDRKERLLIEAEQKLAQTQEKLAQTQEKLAQTERQLAQTRWELSELQRKTRIYMKCRRFAGRVLRAIKWRVKRLLGKGNTK